MLSEKRNRLYILIPIILTLNGILSITLSLLLWKETVVWAIVSASFIFLAGITQAGIIVSAIMRIAGAEWGRHYARYGVIITLSSAPLVVILFIFISYAGGYEYLSHAVSHGHGYKALWFNKDFFIWRNLISMGLFYISSYWYYKQVPQNNGRGNEAEYLKSINVYAGIVILFYVIHNTIMAWDFAMTIIPDWESSILPPYFIAGNLLSGTAFLLVLPPLFVDILKPYKVFPLKHYPHMGKILLGLSLLWIYMLWSQYIVIWYGDIPALRDPLFMQMTGDYKFSFLLMIITAFILPLIALIQRWVRSSVWALLIISISICTGILLNKYLMVLPYFPQGTGHLFLIWTALSLTGGGIGIIIISVIMFHKLFPDCFDALSYDKAVKN